MFAKQTLASASLLVWLVASARADPAAPTDGEVRSDQPSPPPSGPSGVFGVGLGYNTDDGFGTVARVAQPNLFHTGNLLELDASIAERRQTFLLRFVDPDVADSRLSLGGDLYNDTRQFQALSRQATGATATLGTQIADHLRAFVGYRLEDVSVQPDVLARGGPIGNAPIVTSGVRAGVVYDSRDQRDEPLTGTHAGITLERDDRRLGSDLDLSKGEAWFSHSMPVPIVPVTLHVGADARWVLGGGEVPLGERIFLDGSRDLRGYAVGGLMPQGGDTLMTAHAEAELHVTRSISLLGFEEVGAMGYRGSYAQGSSYGVGLLWRSPIGPLRIDYAFPRGAAPCWVIGIGGTF